MKKLFLWMLALAMVLGLASCAEKDNGVLPGVDQVDETEEEVMPTEDQMEAL
jgi:predicted small lipoprotein YifL